MRRSLRSILAYVFNRGIVGFWMVRTRRTVRSSAGREQKEGIDHVSYCRMARNVAGRIESVSTKPGAKFRLEPPPQDMFRMQGLISFG